MAMHYIPDHNAYAFISFDMGLDRDDRLHFVSEAISMYREREQRRTVKGESYEGVLTTDGSRAFAGGWAGQLYQAMVETDAGKCELSFILSQRFDPNMN